MTRLRLDHIVIGAASLDQGQAWLQSRLGLPPVGGGKHPIMGTHNALWRLDSCYLEVIAIDPGAALPRYPRWFGLDNPVTAAKLRSRPRVLTWVVSTNGITLDAESAPVSVGPILDVRRDLLSWRMTVPKDGSLPGGGDFPTLIEWGHGVVSPADSLPAQDMILERLTVGLSGDRARWLTARGVSAPVVFSARPGLAAVIKLPGSAGSVTID